MFIFFLRELACYNNELYLKQRERNNMFGAFFHTVGTNRIIHGVSICCI